jgi:DNA-binding transcriptional regulator GbsR (MarR family)
VLAVARIITQSHTTGAPSVGSGKTMSEMGQSSTGKIVWCIAVHQPITANEIADKLGIASGSASTQALKLWRNKLVVRRRRESSSRGAPYEYAI